MQRLGHHNELLCTQHCYEQINRALAFGLYSKHLRQHNELFNF